MGIRLVEWSEKFMLAHGSPSLVGDWTSCALIPRIHRALADPSQILEYPKFRRTPVHEEAKSYWEAAVHVLYLLLGWADAAKGLQTWYRAGKPTADARLALLREIYDTESQLDLLARHLWEHGSYAHSSGLLECAGRSLELSPTEERRGEAFMGEGWVRSFEERYPAGAVRHDPFHGGSNVLHLMWSIDRPREDQAYSLYADPRQLRAVVVLDEARGWYWQLARAANDLKAPAERSWHVDVLVKPVGWMGTFRRSRVTGIWFQGKHSVHMMGN